MSCAPSIFSARMHAIEVHWKLRTSKALVIGPEPKLVLAARARREDVELRFLRIDYPKMGNREAAGSVAEMVLALVPHAYGLRRLKPTGEPIVWGQEDVVARAMLGGRPEDAAGLPEQIRWHGGTVRAIEYNRNAAPNIWCVCPIRMLIPKGLSVGLIVRADRPTLCRALLAGV